MKTLYKILFLLSLFTFFTCVDEEPEIPIGTGNKIIVEQNQDTVSYWKAIYNGTITNVKERNILQHGHCWDTLPTPDLLKDFTSLGNTQKDIEYQSILENLQPGKTYYIRGYFQLENENEAAYTSEETFNTPKIKIPKITFGDTTQTTLYSAKLFGNIQCMYIIIGL